MDPQKAQKIKQVCPLCSVWRLFCLHVCPSIPKWCPCLFVQFSKLHWLTPVTRGTILYDNCSNLDYSCNGELKPLSCNNLRLWFDF
jgi:hypothetical protein